MYGGARWHANIAGSILMLSGGHALLEDQATQSRSMNVARCHVSVAFAAMVTADAAVLVYYPPPLRWPPSTAKYRPTLGQQKH